MVENDDTIYKYHHPFRPYDIQIELMNAIYDTIDKKYKIGLFESPTGTGKTLSVICATMSWLRSYKKIKGLVKVDHLESECSSDEDPEWVKQAYSKSLASRSKGKLEDYETYLEKLSLEYKSQLQEIDNLGSKKKKRRIKSEDKFLEDELVPEEYHSDIDSNSVDGLNSKLKNEIKVLMDRTETPNGFDESSNDCPIKIYYASRTHSQLNQFADQLALPKFNSSFEDLEERTKYISLGSRKQLCINPKINRLSNNLSLNDACLDLQKLKEGCKYLPRDNPKLIKKFSDLAFTQIHDIEELGKLGNNLNVCPYYSVRSGIDLTEIISLPYQMLLEGNTRRVLNLKIDDSIVVIDEAHNLLDIINSMNSVSITIDELKKVVDSLKLYLNKFLRRLSSGNRIYLMKLIKLCQILVNFITGAENIHVGSEILVDSIFKKSTGDLINVHKIEKYLEKSKIAYKIETYMERMIDSGHKSSSSNPLLFKITKFLKCLNNPSKEGKLFWDKKGDFLSINYMLLDPSEVFRDIVERARCVILCGGTMEPISDYLNYLFPYVPKSQIKAFSCEHIIPKENLEVYPIESYSRIPLDFLFLKRNDRQIIRSLGAVILAITKKTPFGTVAFFPSYKYLNEVVKVWKETGIFEEINNLKQIFQESAEFSAVDSILDKYKSKIIERREGAILFAVVGGRLSEGINFSDDLARAVVMVGLPFPNAYSGEIMARKNFIEANTILKGGTSKDAKENSNDFYENICMRAINQSIGRSIRHANDYAIIYLIDRRYGFERIQLKLSGWVRKRLRNDLSFNDIIEHSEEFFRSKTVVKLK
ncbi:uncharacterized protein PRCAT00004026001 [Priceomyces carsonii]|uniref:uncharacterized protein n=1 Tax=Priceomyces carsonii TaxID=28549 RepID=UPI002EDBB41A|nr:unnamed protein product [Priceomyces carsonii]